MSFENSFSWSASRASTLEACARKYFLTYYRSFGGWNANADADSKQVYALKKLDTRATWGGHIAHQHVDEAISLLLKGKAVDPNTVIDRAHSMMRRDWAMASRRRPGDPAKALRMHRGQKFYGLVEFELDVPVKPEEWVAGWNDTKNALEWWFASEWPTRIAALREDQVLATDSGNFDANRFKLADTHVLSTPDLAFVNEHGRAQVVDWKAGKPRSEHATAIVGYGYHMLEKHGVPPEDADLHIVYLGKGESRVPLDTAVLEDWKLRALASVENMRSYLVDTEKNKPKPEAAFRQTEDRKKCEFCAYRRRCDREGKQ